MTERLADIEARIGGVRQLGAVVNAMRGIAAARVQQAKNQLVAVDSYAHTVALAIGRVGAMVSPSLAHQPTRSARTGLVIFCAEQGFAGAFSERVLDVAGFELGTSELFLIGTRGAAVAGERGVIVGWRSAMPARSENAPKLADHIVDALYARLVAGTIGNLDVISSRWSPGQGVHIDRQRLLPIDLAAFPISKADNTPLLTLEPDVLVAGLIGDYLHARICNAGLHSFAAENAARMEAMAMARSHIERQLLALQSRQRLVRQEQITAEIIELSAGEMASAIR